MKRSLRILAATLLVGFGAHAQSKDTAKADALFREGRAALKAGDYETACPRLEESYRLDPAAGTAVNLGDCFERQGKVASALLAYQAAGSLLKPGDPRATPVKLQIAALERRVPRITITLAPNAPPGTTVKRDGRIVSDADFGKPLVINPGRVEIAVESRGREDRRYKLILSEGQIRELVAEAGDTLGDDEQDPTPRERDDAAVAARREKGKEPSSNSSSTTGFVLGGIGLAGVAVGATTALMANQKKQTVDENCNQAKVCNQAGIDAADSGKSLTTVSFVGWGIGVAGVTAGAFLLLSGGANEPTTAVGAGGSRAGGELTISGRFW